MRRNLISIWNLSDPIYFQCTRLTYIDDPDRGFKNIFRVRLTSYQGKPITLSDGTVINKHDKLIKIHLHNIRLINETKDIQGEVRKARHIYKTVQASLPGLADFLRAHKHHQQIKGVIGITVLNHKLCRRLGFETFAISNFIYRWFKFIIFISINKLAKDPSAQGKGKQEPKYLFMSKENLLNAYKE
ncbi:YkoP family protein [Sediminibacillus albus]|uniref:YkoP-like domain-containing protein n=1 Tax=Sediminibacillus albus TaxID=407036 RepID=A0A1G8WWE2_9BACI|nr:hypothetical protein [Sediminibacillus albus]SDJ82712.1 hypothetical protein SAMN05216243_1037 [Sediminibacillus albus]